MQGEGYIFGVLRRWDTMHKGSIRDTTGELRPARYMIKSRTRAGKEITEGWKGELGN